MYIQDYGKHYHVCVRFDHLDFRDKSKSQIFYNLDLAIKFIKDSFLKNVKLAPYACVQFFNKGKFCMSHWLFNDPHSITNLEITLKSFKINILDRCEPLKISPKVANKYRVAGTDFHYSFQVKVKSEVGDDNDSKDISTSSRGFFWKVKEFFTK